MFKQSRNIAYNSSSKSGANIAGVRKKHCYLENVPANLMLLY